MKFAKLNSLTGMFSLAITLASVHMFAIQHKLGHAELSIPLAAIFFLGLIVSIGSLYLNLSNASTKDDRFNAGVVFLAGFGVTTALMAIAIFGLPEELRSIPDDIVRSPVTEISAKSKELLTALSSAHWWVHMVLGLALLCAFITVISLFLITDIVGAINATVAGPFFGVVILVLVLLAAYMLLVAAAGAVALTAAVLKNCCE